MKKIILLLYNNQSIINFSKKCLKYQAKIIDVIIFANIKIKIYYDN